MDLDFGRTAQRLAAPRAGAAPGSIASRSLDLSLGTARVGPNRQEAFFDARAANVSADWAQGLRTWWLRHRFYPPEAARNGEDGTVDLELTVNRQGRVELVQLKSRSGSPVHRHGRRGHLAQRAAGPAASRGARGADHDPHHGELHTLSGDLERAKGIEPSSEAWKATALPLCYARTASFYASIVAPPQPRGFRYASQPWHHAGCRSGDGRMSGGHGHVEGGGDKRVALLIAVLALCLALVETGAKSAQTEALTRNVEAANLWAFFQARTIRQTTLRTATEQADLVKPTLDAAGQAATEARQKAWRDTIARYEDEPSTGEGRKQLSEKAKATEQPTRGVDGQIPPLRIRRRPAPGRHRHRLVLDRHRCPVPRRSEESCSASAAQRSACWAGSRRISCISEERWWVL